MVRRKVGYRQSLAGRGGINTGGDEKSVLEGIVQEGQGAGERRCHKHRDEKSSRRSAHTANVAGGPMR